MLRAMFKPAPDSLVARDMMRGQAPWTHAIHLMWSAWLFITPLFGNDGYDLRWLAFTAGSYPLFVFAYAKCCTSPCRQSGWYALLMLAMGFALMPWYVGSFTYFVFGCIMLGGGSLRPIHYGFALLLANAAFIAEGMGLKYPWQALVWLPVTTLIVGVLVQFERFNGRRNAELALSHAEVRRVAAFGERGSQPAGQLARVGADLLAEL